MRISNEATSIELEDCSQEPIHVPGAIQPHGFLMSFSRSGELLRMSHNAGRYFPHKDFAKLKLTDLFPAIELPVTTLPPNPSTLSTPGGTQWNAVCHQIEDEWVVECEPKTGDLSLTVLYQEAARAISEIELAPTLLSACQRAADEVRHLTGYGRVMIYRFDPDWNGEVIAESLESGMESFLGLRYPASDIPAQARALYLKNWIRVIPDVNYVPEPIRNVDSRMGKPLDLTHSFLRSVSPIHLRYLKNMRVGASMSVSLIKEGKLWGLIACHHSEARPVPYERQQSCELVSRFLSLQLAAKERIEDRNRRKELSQLQQSLVAQLHLGDVFYRNLLRDKAGTLKLVGAQGFAVVDNNEVQGIGIIPPATWLKELKSWLLETHANDSVYATDCLADEFPQAKKYREASGILAIVIPEVEPIVLFWFRPEVIRTVNWAGDPKKALGTRADQTPLSPRHSFELWQESVSFHSAPWTEDEREVAASMRRALIEEDLRRQISRERSTRRKLEASNRELDEYGDIIAHDLQEPLRGIHHYSGFLLKDISKLLPDEALEMLKDIHAISASARVLISDLFHYSRVGRVDLSYGEVDLNEVLAEVKIRLSILLTERNANVLIPKPLPRVICDMVRIGEVFANLISNAAKYNKQSEKIIEITCDESKIPPVFSVKDNGIGVAKRDQERMFAMFQRIHSGEKFGPGSGAGLALVRRIIEKHGGKIWLESEKEKGTCFFFTLESSREVTRDE